MGWARAGGFEQQQGGHWLEWREHEESVRDHIGKITEAGMCGALTLQGFCFCSYYEKLWKAIGKFSTKE